MKEPPDTIYLFKENCDWGVDWVWCEDPAPGIGQDPEDAIKYIRAPKNKPKTPHEARFDGKYYDPAKDDNRLRKQIGRVFDLMQDGEWRTLNEIEDKTGDPQASISAQLRHLRKERFGGYTVETRARGDRSLGLFEYRLLV